MNLQMLTASSKTIAAIDAGCVRREPIPGCEEALAWPDPLWRPPLRHGPVPLRNRIPVPWRGSNAGVIVAYMGHFAVDLPQAFLANKMAVNSLSNPKMPRSVAET
jgi:hypothetical protein